MTSSPAAGAQSDENLELERLGSELLSLAPVRRPRGWARMVERFREIASGIRSPKEQSAAHLKLAECLQARANARDGIRSSLEAEREAREALRLSAGLDLRVRLHALNDLANILHDRADRRYDATAAAEALAVFEMATSEAAAAGDVAALADLRNNAGGVHSARYRRRHLVEDLEQALSLYRAARTGFARVARLARVSAADKWRIGEGGHAAPAEVSYWQRWANSANNALSLEADRACGAWDRNSLLGTARRMRRVVRVAEEAACDRRLSEAAQEGSKWTAARARHTLAIALSHAGELQYDLSLFEEAGTLWARNHAVWTRGASERDWARLLNSEICNAANLASAGRDAGRLREALARCGEIADLPSFPMEAGERRRPWTFRSAPEDYARVVHNAALLRQDLALLELDQTYLEDARLDLKHLVEMLRPHPGLQLDGAVERLAIVEVTLGTMSHDDVVCRAGLARYRQFAEGAEAAHGREMGLIATISLAQLLQQAWVGSGDPTFLAEARETLGAAERAIEGTDSAQVSPVLQSAQLQVGLSEALRNRDAGRLATVAEELRAVRRGSPPTTMPKEIGEVAALEFDALSGAVRISADPKRWREALPHLEELRTVFAGDTPRSLDVRVCIGQALLASGDLNAALAEWESVQEDIWSGMLQADRYGTRRGLLNKISYLDPLDGPASPSLGDALAMALLEVTDGSGPVRALQAVARGRSLLRASYRHTDPPGEVVGARDMLRRSEALVQEIGRPASLDAAGLVALRRARADADAARAAFSATLAAEGLLEPPRADVDRVLAGLGPKTALVVVLVVETHSVAITLHRVSSAPSISTVRFAGLGTRQLSEMNAELDGCMGRLGPRPEGLALQHAETSVTKLCRTLGKAFADPLATHLKHIGVPPGTELVLMAPGSLAAQPVHAAWLGGDPNYPLLTRFPIRYIQFLPEPRDDAPMTREPGPLLMVSDPGCEWPERRLELGGDVQGGQSRRLEGRTATRKALLRDLADADIFVFEGHGHFDPQRPERSHLSLAGRDKLTLDDIGTVASGRRRLCILTTCEGARLDVGRLSNEFVGLATALIDCGFDEVVASTWPVDRVAAHALVGLFWEQFSNRAGQSRVRPEPCPRPS